MRGWRQIVIVVALMALIASPGSLASEDKSLSAAEIRTLTDNDKNEEAAEEARVLLKNAEEKSGDRSAEVAEALELLARALARAHQGDTEGKPARLALAERALTIRRGLSDGDDMALAWSYYVERWPD